jgi:hypothetical protein
LRILEYPGTQYPFVTATTPCHINKEELRGQKSEQVVVVDRVEARVREVEVLALEILGTVVVAEAEMIVRED